MESAEKSSKTVWVGRYKLDLPADAVLEGASLELNGVPVSITPGYIKSRVEREALKNWKTIENRNLHNAEHNAKKEKLANGSFIFNYDHTRITGEGLDGEPINKVVYSTVAYQWANNMKFKLGNDSTLNKDEQIRLLLERIERDNESDTGGICYAGGCLAHETGDEGAYVNFIFQNHPDLRAKFTSKQYGGEANQPLSQRGSSGSSPSDEAVWVLQSDFQHKTLRNTKRAVNHLMGEEVIEASTEKSADGYLTEINAVWYYPGIPNSNDKPELRLDLDYSYITKEKPINGAGFPVNDETNTLTESEFMKIWNQALDSLIAR